MLQVVGDPVEAWARYLRAFRLVEKSLTGTQTQRERLGVAILCQITGWNLIYTTPKPTHPKALEDLMMNLATHTGAILPEDVLAVADEYLATTRGA